MNFKNIAVILSVFSLFLVGCGGTTPDSAKRQDVVDSYVASCVPTFHEQDYFTKKEFESYCNKVIICMISDLTDKEIQFLSGDTEAITDKEIKQLNSKMGEDSLTEKCADKSMPQGMKDWQEN